VYRQDYPFSPLDAERNGLVEEPGEKWVILRISSSVSLAILARKGSCSSLGWFPYKDGKAEWRGKVPFEERWQAQSMITKE
jgi:hypothetical protein